MKVAVSIRNIHKHNDAVNVVAKAAVQRFLDLYDGERAQTYPDEGLNIEHALRLLHSEGFLLDSELPTFWGGRA